MAFSTYKIWNDLNSKLYVGCTIRTIETRWRVHITNGKYLHAYQSPTLNQAMHDLGVEHFFIELLEEYPDRAAMLAGERYWIRALASMEPHGYNSAVRKLSDEAIITVKTNALGLKQREYATMFGVSIGTIASVQDGRVGADILPNYFDEMRQALKEKDYAE